ncbi:MAG: 4Fe-4S binding protein [Candidatus Methanomethylicaceae archaeon]
MKIAEGAVILEPGSSTRYETGNWRTFRPVVDPKKCTSCGICWLYCPDIAIGVIQKGRPAEIDYRYCKGCGICANECPVKAITMVSEERS